MEALRPPSETSMINAANHVFRVSGIVIGKRVVMAQIRAIGQKMRAKTTSPMRNKANSDFIDVFTYRESLAD